MVCADRNPVNEIHLRHADKMRGGNRADSQQRYAHAAAPPVIYLPSRSDCALDGRGMAKYSRGREIESTK